MAKQTSRSPLLKKERAKKAEVQASPEPAPFKEYSRRKVIVKPTVTTAEIATLLNLWDLYINTLSGARALAALPGFEVVDFNSDEYPPNTDHAG